MPYSLSETLAIEVSARVNGTGGLVEFLTRFNRNSIAMSNLRNAKPDLRLFAGTTKKFFTGRSLNGSLVEPGLSEVALALSINEVGLTFEVPKALVWRTYLSSRFKHLQSLPTRFVTNLQTA